MALVTDRRDRAVKGLVVEPHALGSTPVLADGQVVPVTDQPGINLMVRKGGALVPAVDAATAAKIKTTSDIVMSVDPVAGVSPVSGTTVTSQAEYTALGAPLRYVQDVLDILPPFLNHMVTADLAAGNHYAKVATGGLGSGAVLDTFHAPQSFCPSDNYPVLILTPVPPIYTNAIRFRGHRTTIESGIAGTWTAGVPGSNLFTRSSGTWIVDELKGKRVSIDSGVGAGGIRVVISNTTTTLTTATNVSTGGASTISTFLLDSILVPKTEGGTSVKYLYYDYAVGNAAATHCLVQLSSLQLGNDADPAQYGNSISGSTWIYYCDFKTASYVFSGYVGINTCVFDPKITEGDMLNLRGTSSSISLTSNYFRGPGVGNHIWSLETPLITLSSNYFEARSGFSGYMVRDLGRAYFWVTGKPVFAGNGLCTAFYLAGNDFHRWEGSATMQIDNCAVALRAAYAELNLSGLTGSGNSTVFSLANGSTIRTNKSGTTITGTTYATIDGTTYLASDFAAAGDGVEGPLGSSLDMT